MGHNPDLPHRPQTILTPINWSPIEGVVASRHLVPTGVGRPTGVLSACGQSLATVRAAVSPLR
jgi:hypothetical protein